MACNEQDSSRKYFGLKGDVIESRQKIFSNNGSKDDIGQKHLLHEMNLKFKDDGLVKEENFKGKGYDVTYKYYYNDDGFITKKEEFSNNKLISIQNFTQKSTTKFEVIQYNENNEKEGQGEGEFINGRIKSLKIKDNNEEVIKDVDAELDNGYVVKENIGNQIVHLYEYDDGILSSEMTIYKYDSVPDTTITRFEIAEVDSLNNWTKRYSLNSEGERKYVSYQDLYYFNDPKILITNNIIGMWNLKDDNDWIEFKESGKYDWGFNTRIKESGSWELNENDQIITFRGDNPEDSKKYKYSYEINEIILSNMEGKRKEVLIKN
jgi:hypothetical protein